MRGFLLSLIFILTLSLSANAFSEFTWTERCIRAQDACIRLDFQEVKRLTAEEKRMRPGNLTPYYLEGKADFLQAFILEEDSLVDLLKERNSRRIDLLKKGNPKDPHKRLFIAELYLHQAAVRVKSQEFFGAVYDTRKANLLLQENHKLHSGFKPNLLGLGFIHCVAGSIPKNYQWLAGLLGFNGTVNTGIHDLRTLLLLSSKNGPLRHIHDETLLCLTFLELALLPHTEHAAQKERFGSVQDICGNPLLVYAKGAVHAAAAENDSVLALVKLFRARKDTQAFKFLHLLEGNARLFKLDPAAENCFLSFLKSHGGKTYMHSILQRLAWTRLLKSDLAGYKMYLERMSTLVSTGHLTDEDRAAIDEWKSAREPNIVLLRARLLFDGGYYSDALNTLATLSPSTLSSFRDQLEFTYRIARIYHKQGRYEPATRLYESTIKNGAAHPYYFAANAALHLGQVYESKGEKNKARAYYKKTLEFRNHEFQNSIDQKAKAGLNRLSN